MMLLSSYILTFPFWALTWKASFTHAAAAPITQAFEISFEKNQGGNCAYVGEDLLNNIFKDCLTLAEIGMNMTQVYGTDIKAKRVIDAFFGDSTDLLSDQQTEVIRMCQEEAPIGPKFHMNDCLTMLYRCIWGSQTLD